MPPDVAAAIAKLRAHQPLSPAERALIQNYGKQMTAKYGGGAGNESASGPGGDSAAAGSVNFTATNPFTTGSAQATNPCTKKGKAIGFGNAPSEDAYLSMAKDAGHAYRAHLLSAAQTSLDATLAKNPGAGNQLAVMLVAHGNGSAAVVSAAYAAERSPADAMVASNLGAILRGMHDYARAAIALQYAESKAPNDPVVSSNLGWLAMGQGDAQTAGKFFEAAMGKDPHLAPALLGEGLIAQCGGHPAQAISLFRASAKNGYSEMAEAGILSAEADLLKSNDLSADTTPPSYYGPQSQSSDAPNWQDPPFPKDAVAFAAMAAQPDKQNPLRTYIDKYVGGRISADTAAIKASMQASLEAMRQGHRAGTTTGSVRQLHFDRGYRRERFEIADITRILTRETKPVIDQWGTDVHNAELRDGCIAACAGEGAPVFAKCSKRGMMIGTVYPPIHAEESQDWTTLRKNFADLYGFIRPVIAQIADPNVASQASAATDGWVTDQMSLFTGATMTLWQREVEAAVDPRECGTAASPPLTLKPLKPYKVDPTACRTPPISWNFGFGNLNADCDKMTLSIGEGLVAAAEWKFAPDYTQGADGVLRPTGTDWSNDQITLFVGAGGQGTVMPTNTFNPNGAIGGFVTIQNGQLIDAGGQAQVGVSPGVDPASLQLGATGKVGIMSGPDVSTSTAVRIGAPCGFSC